MLTGANESKSPVKKAGSISAGTVHTIHEDDWIAGVSNRYIGLRRGNGSIRHDCAVCKDEIRKGVRERLNTFKSNLFPNPLPILDFFLNFAPFSIKKVSFFFLHAY